MVSGETDVFCCTFKKIIALGPDQKIPIMQRLTFKFISSQPVGIHSIAHFERPRISGPPSHGKVGFCETNLIINLLCLLAGAVTSRARRG